MGNTEFDKGLRDLANSLRNVVSSNMEPADALVHCWPNAGAFNLGTWLERIVDDRRNAIVAHFAHLNTSLSEMADALYVIAEKFDQVDEKNAGQIKDIFDGKKKSSEDKMKIWNTDREKVEENHSGGDRNPGDGYAQNVNIPFDPAGREQKNFSVGSSGSDGKHDPPKDDPSNTDPPPSSSPGSNMSAGAGHGMAH